MAKADPFLCFEFVIQIALLSPLHCDMDKWWLSLNLFRAKQQIQTAFDTNLMCFNEISLTSNHWSHWSVP